MNINSTSNTNYVSLINSNLSGSVTAQPVNCSGASQPAATLGISPAGDFLSKLQQLQSSNPAQFKQTMTDISNQLTSAAGNATGQQAQMLSYVDVFHVLMVVVFGAVPLLLLMQGRKGGQAGGEG